MKCISIAVAHNTHQLGYVIDVYEFACMKGRINMVKAHDAKQSDVKARHLPSDCRQSRIMLSILISKLNVTIKVARLVPFN